VKEDPAAGGSHRPRNPQAASQDEAVRRLERELRRMTEERDILKKAVAFFANERK
jgi:transposase